MKKIISALLAVAALACLATASADTTAGTGADPLVSQTYADGEVYRNLTGSAGDAIENALENAVSQHLADANIDGVGGVITALSWRRVVLSSGGSVEMRTGCEFSLASGTASVTANGTVIDLGAGREITGTESLVHGIKYFAAEDTRAIVTAEGDTIIYVCGQYRPISGVSDAHIYADVADPAAWYYADVYWAYDNRLFHNREADLFYPHSDATRADVVYALWVAAGSPEPREPSVFTDVAAGSWSEKAITWAQESGIVNGYGDGQFGAGDNIIREQIAAVFMRYANYLGRNTERRTDISQFADYGEVSDWAREYVAWANAEGLINGIGDNKLGALGTTTRSQVAALLKRLFAQ